MADTGVPPPEPGLEPRVARLESDVAHILGDVAEIRVVLHRLAPLIDEFHGFMRATLPMLVTKVELADTRAELKAELADIRAEFKAGLADIRAEFKAELAGMRGEFKAELAALKLEIMLRPTRRQSVFDIFAIVALTGAVLTIAARLAH